MKAHDRQWFLDRIGKPICMVYPYSMPQNFIIIRDSLHAEYLYLVQGECGYRYSDPIDSFWTHGRKNKFPHLIALMLVIFGFCLYEGFAIGWVFMLIVVSVILAGWRVSYKNYRSIND